jgi:hypothetical protein
MRPKYIKLTYHEVRESVKARELGHPTSFQRNSILRHPLPLVPLEPSCWSSRCNSFLSLPIEEPVIILSSQIMAYTQKPSGPHVHYFLQEWGPPLRLNSIRAARRAAEVPLRLQP